MSRTKVLVLGSSFAGLTAALEVKRKLRNEVDVTVVSKDTHFVFNPSLIWLPFGKRRPRELRFHVANTLEFRDIEYVHAEATGIDLETRTVTTTVKPFEYDYLVIATGYRNDFDVIPGLGPGGNAHTITTLADAIDAGRGWRKFLEDPGPVVVGATQHAGCFGAAYEFLFNTSHQLKKAGLHKRVPLTYVTAEPCLGDFGIGGLPNGEKLLNMFLKMSGIGAIVNVAMDTVDDGQLVLTDGQKLDFKYAMIVPPFVGQDFLKKVDGIADDKGYIKVKDTYQTYKHPNVYAVGIAAQVEAPWTTAIPTGIPKTGFPTEVMAKTAAANIASQIRDEPVIARKEFGDIPAICIMDAGNNGVMILADRMLPPRKAGVLIPGPQSHWAKLAFEKYYLWKMRQGHVLLP